MTKEFTQITLATQSHFPDVIALISACRNELLAKGINQWDDQYPNPDSILHDLEDGNLFIAELREKLVGAVALNQEQEPEYSAMPWVCPSPCLVVHRLCVSPVHQGNGIGSALMRFAEQRATGDGLGSIRLDVYSGNPRVVNLYQHLGYKIVGQFKYPSRDLPFLCMEKRIDQSTDHAYQETPPK
jgi:ribosomal protein S18 acetylase RimI-like enzyme